MKRILSFTFTYFLVIGFVNSQDEIVGSNFYINTFMNNNVASNILKQNENENIQESVEIEYGVQVKVLNVEGGRVYFKYFDFDNEPDKKAIYNIDEAGKTRVFSMSKSDFEKLTKKYFNKYRGMKYGAFTVPVRLRRIENSFEFDNNFTLGANLLARFGSRTQENLFVDISFGIGLTKVNLNKSNSKLGEVSSDYENIDALSPTAFTTSIGLRFNFAKNVSIGGYWGWDELSSSDNNAAWVFNRKRWTGIGLNIGFSGKADDSSAKK